ncbi:hypothetical protein [Porphyromonas sp.]|uniref:hypothetical protein n=1 Tax=Porphyromonas sp. TaxID=1924944 RepID=UPI0026DA6FF0|nr:hypothetical protein [Porphyromonas sp.]MDO4771652.1 hypothetical protein [Porphyromonas sp.]
MWICPSYSIADSDYPTPPMPLSTLVAYGLSAKLSLKRVSESTRTVDINLFKDGMGEGSGKMFNPFDFGVQVGAGVEFSRIMIVVGTQYGLRKLFATDDSDASKVKNISFYASVGYRF